VLGGRSSPPHLTASGSGHIDLSSRAPDCHRIREHTRIPVYYALPMTEYADQSLQDLAHAISDWCRRLSGFEATEAVDAGPIHVEAHVAVYRSGHLDVAFQTYEHPLLELEQQLTGDAEYVPDEIVGLSLHFDGQQTWLHDPSTDVCIVKTSRFVFEPFHELSLMGDIQHLRDLPHDYLLRELDPETIDGRETRVLSLKPKKMHRVHVAKLIAFLATKLSVAIDVKSLFPSRLVFSPAPSTQASLLLGPHGQISIRYSNVRLPSATASPFSPPEGTRILHEDQIPVDELPGSLPFTLPLAPLHDAGFSPMDDRALLARDAEHARAYFKILLLRTPADSKEPSQYITLRAGNYMNRNMARRRVTAAEAGEKIEIHEVSAWYLDRRSVWEEHAPQADSSQAPRELCWEHDGVFWFLIGVDVERSDLEQLASSLVHGTNASD